MCVPPENEEVMMGNVFSGDGGGRCFCCYQAQKRQRRASYNKTEVKALTDLIAVSECLTGGEGSVLGGSEDRLDHGGAMEEGSHPSRGRSPLEERILQPLPSPKVVSEADIHGLFDVYRDGEDVILSEGVQKLCADLELAPEEFRILVLAWKCRAERMCRLTRSEFLEGLKSLGADNVSSLKSRLTEVSIRVSEMEEPSTTLSYNASFRDLYRFTYKFGLEPGQRILPTDMAISLWQLVFSQRTASPSLNVILPKWFNFLKIHSFIRGISKDTWNMFLNFLEIVGSDLSSYDDTEAWPSLLDDFVEFENEEVNRTSSSHPLELPS